MKACVLVFLLAACYVQCRKLAVPIDKNANLAFINMEGGGGPRPNSKPAQQPAVVPPANNPTPTPVKVPALPTSAPKPVVAPTAKPAVVPAKPTPQTQIKPVPVNPTTVKNLITTPGPGNVKQLVTFYDSQGKASLIRPYSYSQAVKQG